MEYLIITLVTIGLFAFGCLGIFLIDKRMRREDEDARK